MTAAEQAKATISTTVRLEKRDAVTKELLEVREIDADGKMTIKDGAGNIINSEGAENGTN